MGNALDAVACWALRREEEMKRKKLSAMARTIEQEAIDIEEWLNLHQSKLPRRVRIQINEAIRSLDDATFYLDEKSARK